MENDKLSVELKKNSANNSDGIVARISDINMSMKREAFMTDDEPNDVTNKVT